MKYILIAIIMAAAGCFMTHDLTQVTPVKVELVYKVPLWTTSQQTMYLHWRAYREETYVMEIPAKDSANYHIGSVMVFLRRR